jgi:murein DD-endopeptidase MepM/ murein hydrolase activator NlpD
VTDFTADGLSQPAELSLASQAAARIDFRGLRDAVRREIGPLTTWHVLGAQLRAEAPRQATMVASLSLLLFALFYVTHQSEPGPSLGPLPVVAAIAPLVEADLPSPIRDATNALITSTPFAVSPAEPPAPATQAAPARQAAHAAALPAAPKVVKPPVSVASAHAASQAALFGPPLNDYSIDSGFGWRREPFTGHPEFHAGIDLAAPYGSTVYSAQEGTVVFAGRHAALGLLVEIDHGDGLTTWYAHLEKILVKAGAHVNAHQQIALLGSSGHSTGPHLHYEVRIDDKFVDPKKFL